MSTREVMQQALDALDDEIVLYCEEGGHIPGALINAVAALKSELAKPEPEPVAWANDAHNFSGNYSTFVVACHKSTGWDIPLYRKDDVK